MFTSYKLLNLFSYILHREMSLTNFTGDTKQKPYQELECSAELTGNIHNQLINLSVLNIFLSITAFLGNTVILAALHKESSLHPPSKFLLRNLATTDLCVGIIAEPLAVVNWISAVNKRWNICRFTVVTSLITGYMLCSVSLCTLTAISVDRLLALLLGLRYRQVVTLKRTYVTVIVFWVVPIFGSTTFLWSNLIFLWYGNIVIPLCLVTSIYSYTRIFLTLRHHRTHVEGNVQGQQSQTSHLNIARYRKAVTSALWLQLTLVACYLPFSITWPLTQSSLSSNAYLASQFTITLVFLNSSINPILYCWKITEVRQAAKDTIRQLFCSPN